MMLANQKIIGLVVPPMEFGNLEKKNLTMELGPRTHPGKMRKSLGKGPKK